VTFGPGALSALSVIHLNSDGLTSCVSSAVAIEWLAMCDVRSLAAARYTPRLHVKAAAAGCDVGVSASTFETRAATDRLRGAFHGDISEAAMTAQHRSVPMC
jgi:hypothetical protein